MRRFALLAIVLLLAGRSALAESTMPATSPDLPEAPEEKAWSFSLSAYTYIVPHDTDYVQPTLRADHDWLHLEARYNYEDRDTASVWLGYNWSFGKEVTLDLTGMVGGVFGNTHGVGPGYELTLAWKKLQLYSEAEYIFDCDDESASFLYTWSELTWSFTDWLRAGIVVERTKAYETDFDIQRGFIVGLTYKHLDFTCSLLNPDNDPIVVLGVAYEF
jgi:hypothetical protein